ncbi:hypothetical protein H0H81_007189 [Sphagnurus paluster]|uniref:asparaginase n=1 Tax=Sphagnurus paluster TaxID=117069 RepID=A0A9P7GNZ4_9AGAR|nr:hypothetical protein H0H81_007189 [Sphagnurus paluster]
MPPIRGVVLETFGAGNAPQRADLMEALKEGCDRGVVVVAITQCSKGSVSDAYETGRTLLQCGVVSGNDMTPECALTKLSYLLSKPELSVEEIRELIRTPLRGELTRPTPSMPAHPATVEKTVENIEGVLSEFVRLTSPQTRGPQITLSSDTHLDAGARDATSPWTWTVAEAANTEAVLIPFLVHLAAARNDIGSLQFCLEALGGPNSADQHQFMNFPGGVVNCLDVATGQTPLHAASLNGSAKAVELLLHSGALVHLRDLLGHTALYYAARQGHEEVVDILVQAGATLGGFDESLAVALAKNTSVLDKQNAARIWSKAGVKDVPLADTFKPEEDERDEDGRDKDVDEDPVLRSTAEDSGNGDTWIIEDAASEGAVEERAALVEAFGVEEDYLGDGSNSLTRLSDFAIFLLSVKEDNRVFGRYEGCRVDTVIVPSLLEGKPFISRDLEGDNFQVRLKTNLKLWEARCGLVFQAAVLFKQHRNMESVMAIAASGPYWTYTTFKRAVNLPDDVLNRAMKVKDYATLRRTIKRKRWVKVERLDSYESQARFERISKTLVALST